MAHHDGGFFELVTDAAGAGTRYRYQLEDGTPVPDPATRSQPLDEHGPSEVVDPGSYRWQHADWHGRPWHETVSVSQKVAAHHAIVAGRSPRDR
jgi:maltooligosyltrehalose trehalohydrolase